MGPGRVAPGPIEHDRELVGAGGDRAHAAPNPARLQRRVHMEGHDPFQTIYQPFVYKLCRTSGKRLLGRLEQQLDRDLIELLN